MTIKYYPEEMLKKIAPAKKIEKLVSGNLTLNRAVLSMFDDADFISKGQVKNVALKTIKRYKEKYKDERAEGASKSEAIGSALSGKKLLVQRVQNDIVWQVSQEIKDQYQGESFRWLPSDAVTPDPEHQLNYGKVFQIGDGEIPGERDGCQCGMEIFVKEKSLNL